MTIKHTSGLITIKNKIKCRDIIHYLPFKVIAFIEIGADKSAQT